MTKTRLNNIASSALLNPTFVASAFLLLAVILPTSFCVVYMELGTWESLLMFLYYGSCASLTSALFLASSRSRLKTVLYPFLVGIIGLFYAATWFSILYWIVAGNQFDLLYALDSHKDIAVTLWKTLGLGIILPFSLLGLVWILCWLIPYYLYRFIVTRKPRLFAKPFLLGAVIVILCSSLALLPIENRLVVGELRNALLLTNTRSVIAPIALDTSNFKVSSSETLLMLQIESSNSIAIHGQAKVNGVQYSGNFVPELSRIARNGIYIPYFWGTAVQSNRTIISAMCGITNNVGKALSYTPTKIRTTCLPEILRKAGYHTSVYWGYDSPNFTNLDILFKHIGFDNLYYSNIMPDNSQTNKWGVDDCAFYEQVIKHLKNSFAANEKLFAYIKVSSHHYPFPGTETYKKLHAFAQPREFIEFYLNSILEQDYCLGRFYDSYSKLRRTNDHLFIFADHSWPVGIHGSIHNEQGAYNENFLVPLVYLPPAARSDEFNIGSILGQQFSMNDLLPTVLDLLNNNPYPNSFASMLRTGNTPSDYENCHLLIQPYSGGQIAVIKDKQKYLYQLTTRTLLSFDLQMDPEEKNPTTVATNLPYEQFRENYYCKRFQDSEL